MKILVPRRFEDARGFFCETYSARVLRDAAAPAEFVQDNHVLSREAFTLRGIHYQIAPHRQAKLVRVLRGAVRDFAIDLRRGSPTFGKHVSATLTDKNWMQFLIPEGFGHGILTIEPNTEFIYKVSALYSPENERGIRFDDPDLAVDWGVPNSQIILSDRDRRLPSLREQKELP